MKLSMRVSGLLFWSLLFLSGCSELGQIGFPGDYGNWGGSDLVGEVRDVDTRARQIELSTDAGRKFLVRYDNNTRVSYRQRDYAVANLEPGDYVAMRAQQDRDGRYFTDLITVKESVQERGGYSGSSSGSGNVERLEKLEGRVESVDSRRGTLENSRPEQSVGGRFTAVQRPARDKRSAEPLARGRLRSDGGTVSKSRAFRAGRLCVINLPSNLTPWLVQCSRLQVQGFDSFPDVEP